ncbi:MAG: DNA topoisomerase IV subunit A [Euryarchaeota archaeon]|nr:DNA topoisomerase IV subunit A [Euryarchaeota archaeon]
MDKKTKMLNELKLLGTNIIDYLRKGEPPKLQVPSRITSNIVYDPVARCYVLGDKYKLRSAGNIAHVKKIAQTMCVATFGKELAEKSQFATLREMYYYGEGWPCGKFVDQQESDMVAEDLEVMLGCKREDFGIYPEESGAGVFGDVLVREPDGNEIHAEKAGMGGYTIPPIVDDIEFVRCGAKRLIAVETLGYYHRLVQERAYKRFDALIVGLKGQASRATRRMIRRLHGELKLPVYVFTDGDPWGSFIAMVVISGSAKAAHVNKELATPNAIWIGVTPEDITKYKLPTDKFNDQDFKRIEELKKDPRYQGKFWQKQLELWEKMGAKSEQQGLARHGLSYVVEKYLPDKIREHEPNFKPKPA